MYIYIYTHTHVYVYIYIYVTDKKYLSNMYGARGWSTDQMLVLLM